MTVYEICQRHVVTVRRHEDLATAAWMMRERNVGCLVVVEPAGAIGGERVVGLLTDRDIVTHVVASNADPHGMIVDDVMTRHPVMASSTASIDEALHRMRAAGVRRVPLVDDRGRLAGIVALDDIFDYLAQRGAPFVTSIVANRTPATPGPEPSPRQDRQRHDLHAAP
jgi:CBS domain-containing protein